MTRSHRWVSAAVASIVLLGGCSSGAPEQGSTAPDGSGSAEGGPTTLVAGSEALPAGTYRFDLEALAPTEGQVPSFTITIPDGWGNLDGWGIITGEGKQERGLSFWDVDEVYKRPCSGNALIQPGPTVADLARALGQQPMRDATEPADIVVDGFKGVQLEWSVPADFDFSKCDDGRFDSWTANGGSWNGGRYQQGPGQVDRLWILDVDGERLVVDASFMPSTTPKDREELWMVVDSIRFET